MSETSGLNIKTYKFVATNLRLSVYETSIAKKDNIIVIRQGNLLDCLILGIIVQSKWRSSALHIGLALNGNGSFGDGE